jgi:hypothetical protein
MNASNSLPTGTPHATAAAKTRRAAEPDSGLDAIEQEQKVALVAARVRHAPRQRLVAQIGLRSLRERHDRSLEIGATVVAQQHEHALKHRRVSSRLDQRSNRFSTTPFVVLQRRICSATETNDDTTHTMTFSTQSTASTTSKTQTSSSKSTFEFGRLAN